MSRRVVVLGLALATALLVTTAAQRAAPAPPTARAAACDALGVAGSFAVFAHQNFSAAKTGGGNIAGRIAAGGDVRLGITAGPAAGDVAPTVIAGRDFIGAGQDKLTGSVLYGRNFQPGVYEVTGGAQQGAPSFSFDEEFQKLALLSDTWSKESQTPGASAALESGAFVFHGFTTGPNVFNITAAALQPAAGIRISLDRGPQAGTNAAPSVLINVSGTVPITFAPGTPQYMDLGTVSPRRLIWNLPQVTALQVSHQIGWKGLILAPNARISGPQGAQLDGQMIAKDVPSAEWTITRGQLEICPPGPTVPPEPDTSLKLEALCVDPFGNLAMRVANTGDRDRVVHWDDLGAGKVDFGDFDAQEDRYQYFLVRDGDAASRIRMIADPETSKPVRFDAVRGTDQRCGGKITITKQVFGTAAPPGPWTVELTGVDPRGGGVQTTTRQLGAGESVELDAVGGYQPGSAGFGGVVGGIAYTISEPDPPGDAIVEISANPVHILGSSDPEHEQNEPVTITNTYPDNPGGGGGGPEPPVEPGQPTLPPGAPDPPPGPELDGGRPGGANPDLVVTHTVTPGHARVGDTIQTVTRVRNAGPVPARGAVLRELPQYRALEANLVARVQSLSTSVGRCTRRRPVRCDLGTLAPRAEAVVRSRTKVLIAADLQSVVIASSQTPESNTTNNLGLALVSVGQRTPHLRVGISAPPSGRVGEALDYRVSVTGTGKHGAVLVRLCAPRAATLTEVHARATFAYRGARCRDIRELPPGRTVSFAVSGVPAAGGPLHLSAAATAVDLGRVLRATAQVPIGGPAACGSALRRLRC